MQPCISYIHQVPLNTNTVRMQAYCHTVKCLIQSSHVWHWTCGPQSAVHQALTRLSCAVGSWAGVTSENLKPVDLMWYDVTGVEDGIEYQILEPSSEPNATHMKVGIALTAALEILTPFALARPTYCQAVPSVMERSKSFQVSLHKK